MTTSCAICLEDMTEVRCVGNKKIFPRRSSDCSLRCGHLFHQTCIKGWLCKGNLEEEKVGCPMCRQDIVFRRQPFYTHLVHRSRECHRRKAFDEEYEEEDDEDDEDYDEDDEDYDEDDDEDDEDDDEDKENEEEDEQEKCCDDCKSVITSDESWACVLREDGTSAYALCHPCYRKNFEVCRSCQEEIQGVRYRCTVRPEYNLCERCHESSDDDGTYTMTMQDFGSWNPESEERFYNKERMDSYRMLESRKQLWMATRVMTRVASRRFTSVKNQKKVIFSCFFLCKRRRAMLNRV